MAVCRHPAGWCCNFACDMIVSASFAFPKDMFNNGFLVQARKQFSAYILTDINHNINMKKKPGVRINAMGAIKDIDPQDVMDVLQKNSEKIIKD